LQLLDLYNVTKYRVSKEKVTKILKTGHDINFSVIHPPSVD